MDGRNCTGRKISLLNDSSDLATTPSFFPSKIRLPPLAQHSRTSSCASTRSLSAQTPQLVRSSSSDSRTFATPWPLTPSLNSFDSSAYPHNHKAQQHQYYISQSSYAKMDDANAAMYPPIADATGAMPTAYPMPAPMPQQIPPQPSQQIYRASNSPASEPSRVSTVSATSNPTKSQPKKNQYPCPMAKQVGCTDFFTTSGHAARHAKKHTGKKDAFCPECNKAFTRKDNMEQHRRTHQSGRGAGRSSNNNNDESKVKKPTKTPAKKSVVRAEPQQLEAAVEQQLAMEAAQPVIAPITTLPLTLPAQVQAQVAQQAALEQALMLPPQGPYFLNTIDTGPVPALPAVMPDLNVRPPLVRTNFTSSLDYVAPIPAMVADPDSLHYSYPSPGLSNGLHSLALAASEHRRLSEEKLSSHSPQETPSTESPSQESP